jgi:predicted Ser/Thr protein kinase
MSAHAGEERLGPYRLREQLGEGGMGVVYLATDPAERLVAIKVLRQGVAAEETARRRLAHEVETMRRVSSPHVAEVVDADVTGNPPYIVTRFVPGRTLEDVVAADGPVTGNDLARLAKGLAAALDAVHVAGVVHRDLKPGNVMLLDGEPVVIDFGIAQAADSTRLTMTGMFMGTPGYLAPEVIEGRPSGPAADIHSWGATMAFAATGRPPFGSGTFEAIFYRIVHGQPDLDKMPAPLVPLVLSALARDPAKRPSAPELAASCACLDPAWLVPGAPAVAPLAAATPVRTSRDVARPLPAAGAAASLPAAGAAAAGAAAAMAWPGTSPLPARGHDNFADLLTPVRYGQPADLAAAGRSRTSQAQAGVPAGAGSIGAAVGVPGGAAARQAPMARGQALTGSGAARPWLVAATVTALVAASVLLPLGGAAVVLLLLIALSSADLTGRWSARRVGMQGRQGGGSAAAIAYFPWAVCRSVVRFVLLAPLALLCAAGAVVVTVLATGTSALPRAGAWAAGAVVACYCVGPGSAACRRPLGQFYGRITRSGLGAAAGFIALALLAVAAVAAAASLAPGYWPDAHLGQQLQNAPLNHPLLSHLPGNLTQVSKRLISWVGHRL